jgi:V8-like Glu-specific endopeptidase
MHARVFRVASLSTALVLGSGLTAMAQVEDGRVEPASAAVSGYPQGLKERGPVHTEKISSPGAEFLRLLFEDFRLAPGDHVTVSSGDGSHQEVIAEPRGPHGDGEFWSFAIPGDTAVVTVHAGPRRDDLDARTLGYRITRLVHGTLPLEGDGEELPFGFEGATGEPTPSICGTNGNENTICYAGADAARRPVARLLFVNANGTKSVRCTGWLVRGSNASTLMTNNHCFNTAAAVRATEAQFGYRTTTCTGSTLGTFSSYRGNALLRTSAALDYTLMTMLGNPEATWGELIPARRKPVVGENIWVIQHPGGKPQKIGNWEDSAHTARCNVDGRDQNRSGYTAGSQTLYNCDTEGGSSGSVVLAAGTTRAIAIHHLGGCPNAGTEMEHICPHAGTLLTCE